MVEFRRDRLARTIFNAATHFVDRHVVGRPRREASRSNAATSAVTYGQVAERVNRFGSALRGLGIQPEQRIALDPSGHAGIRLQLLRRDQGGPRSRAAQHAVAREGLRARAQTTAAHASLVISAALLREFERSIARRCLASST